jgi:Cu2+-exporting ATPase
LLHKMKVALLFAVPVFIISMEMVPITHCWSNGSQNMEWTQLICNASCFMPAGCFIRAWKSILSWNLNMFTLIGIGTGWHSLQSNRVFFPDIFRQFKTEREQFHFILKQQQLFWFFIGAVTRS